MNEELSGGIKALLVVATIFIPLVGIVLGIMWMTSKDASEEKKKFGKTLLIVAVAVVVVGCICGFGVAMLGVAGAAAM